MQFEVFETLIKDGLNNLFDFAVLETHPLLSNGITIPSNFSGNKGEFLKKVLLEAIENLKPAEKFYDINVPEWRVYIVLVKRYLEGMNSFDVAKLLAMSDRQYRRYQKKAIQSVAIIIWNRFIQTTPELIVEKTQDSNNNDFNIFQEEIVLSDVVQGLNNLLATRFSEENVTIKIEEEIKSARVESDRVILRQILIKIVNTLLNYKTKRLTYTIYLFEDQIALGIKSTVQHEGSLLNEGKNEPFENSIWFWAEKLGINIDQVEESGSKQIEIRIVFSKNKQKTILIIDDQEPAIRLFTRYLSRSNVKIIGISKPGKVLARVKEALPILIILDIMMPKMDGWEVLQSIKLDEKTKNIPVIVCSAWGEPELAKSLGAIEFLRKPVTQRDLLATIQSIGIFN
ncbi:MAG: response regulator [Anaerolineaceae bacterium]